MRYISTISLLHLATEVHGFAPRLFGVTTRTKNKALFVATTMTPTRNETATTTTFEPDPFDFALEFPPKVQVQEQAQVQEQETKPEGGDDLDWFRFGGVGKLYATDTPAATATMEETDEETSVISEEDIILERLHSATVAVVGLGGIGSWTAESLGRSGIGHLVLIDLDDLCISSTSRQLHALSSNVGDMKTQVLADRLKDLSPNIQVTIINDFIMQDTVEEVVSQLHDLNVNMVVDAIDGIDEKASLWKACAQHDIPVLSCGSAAGRCDPTKIVYSSEPKGDKLLESTFQLVQKQSTDAGQKWCIPCVYIPADFQETSHEEGSSFRASDGALGTASFVSGSMGLTAAAKVVEGIAKQTLQPPLLQ